MSNSNTSDKDKPEKKPWSTSQIVGLVVGLLAVVGLSVWAGVMLYRHNQKISAINASVSAGPSFSFLWDNDSSGLNQHLVQRFRSSGKNK